MAANLTKPSTGMLDVVTKPVTRIGSFARDIGKYLLGKGIVSLAVLGSTWSFPLGAASFSLLSPAVAVAGGFLAWKVYREFDGYVGYKKEMLDIYRDEISTRTGIPAQELTVGHLRQIASGDPVLGLPPNPVIAKALKRQRESSVISVLTAAAAAAATFTVLSFGLDQSAVNWFSEQFSQYADTIQKVSVSLVSAVSGLVLHNGLDSAVSAAKGHFTATAHDRITYIARAKSFGKAVTPEQVFDVFLATNPEVAKQVNEAFNKGFPTFTAKEKSHAMRAIGIDQMIDGMAEAINKGELKPASLAFMLDTSQVEDTLQHMSEKSEVHVKEQARAKEAKKNKTDMPKNLPEPLETQAPSTRFRDMVNRPEVARNMSFVDTENVKRAQAARHAQTQLS